MREIRKDPIYSEYCAFLNELGISFHYLRDTRRAEGSDIQHQETVRNSRSYAEYRHRMAQREADELLTPDLTLTAAVEAAVQWFQQRARSASATGYTSVNDIYSNLTRRIVGSMPPQQNASEESHHNLIQELTALMEDNSAFARLGITPEMNVTDMLRDLNSAKKEHFGLLDMILRPYLDGQSARLNALEELQQVMSGFASLLSKFYSNKDVEIHLEGGLRITARTGQKLDPTELSSGEQQLLLLFSNAISARQLRTVLIIDEPEISLNVEWQRDLIPALLTCMSGTSFQLILATHSIELLSQYRDCVSSLRNNRDEAPTDG